MPLNNSLALLQLFRTSLRLLESHACHLSRMYRLLKSLLLLGAFEQR